MNPLAIYFLRYSYGAKMKVIMVLGTFFALTLAFYQYTNNTTILTQYLDPANQRLHIVAYYQVPAIEKLMKEMALTPAKIPLMKQELDSTWNALINNLNVAYDSNSALQSMPAWEELKICLNKSRELSLSLSPGEVHESLFFSHIGKLKNQLVDVLAALKLLQSKTLWHQIHVTWLLSSLGILIAILFYTTRLIRRPISSLKDAAERFGKGDLTIRGQVKTQDEVGDICHAFNITATFVEKTMKSINQISTTLLQLATNVLSTAEELRLTLMGQEEQVNLILHHAQEIAQTVHSFSSTLQLLNRSISQTSAAASIGQTGLTQMEAIMKLMIDASSDIVNTLSSLKNKTANINSIISTIVEIDDQIHLLSLNTAIRANQAGEEGRGFSVIALKIKEIAGQSALTTLDIEKNTKEIVDAVSLSSDEIDNFFRLIQTQGEESTKMSDKLKVLIQETQDKTDLFDQINVEMADQSQRAVDIHKAILSLSHAAKGSTYSIQKLLHEIEYLHQSSTHLDDKIKFFTFT
jgi:methyl-accepting chemotaxis protein